MKLKKLRSWLSPEGKVSVPRIMAGLLGAILVPIVLIVGVMSAISGAERHDADYPYGTSLARDFTWPAPDGVWSVRDGIGVRYKMTVQGCRVVDTQFETSPIRLQLDTSSCRVLVVNDGGATQLSVNRDDLAGMQSPSTTTGSTTPATTAPTSSSTSTTAAPPPSSSTSTTLLGWPQKPEQAKDKFGGQTSNEWSICEGTNSCWKRADSAPAATITVPSGATIEYSDKSGYHPPVAGPQTLQNVTGATVRATNTSGSSTTTTAPTPSSSSSTTQTTAATTTSTAAPTTTTATTQPSTSTPTTQPIGACSDKVVPNGTTLTDGVYVVLRQDSSVKLLEYTVFKPKEEGQRQIVWNEVTGEGQKAWDCYNNPRSAQAEANRMGKELAGDPSRNHGFTVKYPPPPQ